MARAKPVPAKAAPSAAPPAAKGAAVRPRRGPAVRVAAHGAAARTALAAAKSLPGWRGASAAVGTSVAAGDTAVLLALRGSLVTARRRIGAAWQPPAPLVGDDAAAAFAALEKLAVTGRDEPEYTVAVGKAAARSCRVAARGGDAGREVLVLVGAEVERAARRPLGSSITTALGRLVPTFGRRSPAAQAAAAIGPDVTLEPTGPDAAARQAALATADGAAAAGLLVGAAIAQRAGAIRFEASPQGVTAVFDVDGVAIPAPPLDAAEAKAVVGAIQAAAGLDPTLRGRQTGRIVARVAGRPWACSVTARRGSAGSRVELAIEQGRPTFKSLADTGMSAGVAERVHELLKLDRGLILVVAPPRGGLSTLFDAVIAAADRLLRDFVLLEDAAAPRPEIQNVKPVRWDARAGVTPVAALDGALREYPNVLATCDLDDAALAKRLVAQVDEGRLVIVGLRGADAADGLARLAALGIDPGALGRALIGAVGCQLVRKLCPKCRREYLPSIESLLKLGIDPGADVTLFRAADGGCGACTGTGYLGRTAACEVAAGPTVRAYVAKGAAADVLRKAAAKDGMVAVAKAAIAKVAEGATSVDEVKRVFRRA